MFIKKENKNMFWDSYLWHRTYSSGVSPRGGGRNFHLLLCGLSLLLLCVLSLHASAPDFLDKTASASPLTVADPRIAGTFPEHMHTISDCIQLKTEIHFFHRLSPRIRWKSSQLFINYKWTYRHIHIEPYIYDIWKCQFSGFLPMI